MTNKQTKDFESGHAIVIGGSLSGLLAARVLSDHFERVMLLERDHFPALSEHRKGVPQGRHAHGLLASGFMAIKSLFPSLEDELIRAGAVPGDVVGDMRWYQYGGCKAKFNSGLSGLVLSRPLLESAIRRRVVGQPNVQALEGCNVQGLIASPDRRRVCGVRLARRAGGGEEALTAELVVDASGRGSQLPIWLEALGYDRPAQDTIKIGVGYASRVYRRRPGELDGDIGVIINPKPPEEKRLGGMVAMEGDRWMVTLGGWLGDHAPTDEQGYLAFARSLPAADIYDIIKYAEPLSDIAVYKFPSNLRRRYERLARFPEGCLVTGDALCSFNPIYGQGMSVAALEAVALQDCLNEHYWTTGLTELPRRFFKRAAQVIDIPWKLAASADFNYPEVKGRRPMGTGLVNRYVSKVHQVATRDRKVCRAFFDVANLLKPPAHLFRLDIMLRVLGEDLATARAPAHSPTAAG